MGRLGRVAFGLCILAAIAIWAATPCVVTLLRSAPWAGSFTTVTAFTEQFTVTSTLFSALAFTALVFAVVLQMAQLRMQRQELDLMRQEMQKSSEALAAQVYVQRLAAIVSGLPLIIRERKAHLSTLDMGRFPPQSFDSYTLDDLREQLRFYEADLKGTQEEYQALRGADKPAASGDEPDAGGEAAERIAKLKNNCWWIGSRAAALREVVRLLAHLESSCEQLLDREPTMPAEQTSSTDADSASSG